MTEDLNTKHAELAHAVKSAKKLMFKRSREGMDLRVAVGKFVVDVAERLPAVLDGSVSLKPRGASSDYVVATLPDGQEVELYGDAVDLARTKAKKPTAEKKRRETGSLQAQIEQADEQADALLRYFEQPAPDFINDALVDAIESAGEISGLPVPDYDEPEYTQKKMLSELFLQARDLRLRDEDRKVLLAVHELLHNPQAPQDLFNAVAEFICAQSTAIGDKLWHSSGNLAAVLATVEEEDTRGAVIAARAEGNSAVQSGDNL